jgi:hypothetical protein
MSLTAKLYQPEFDGLRAVRVSLDCTGTFRDAQGIPIDVLVLDISRTGVSIRTDRLLQIGSSISLGLPALGRRDLHVVRRDGSVYGCSFRLPIGTEDLASVRTPDTVVRGVFAADPVGAPRGDAEAPSKWPVAARLAFILGASGVLWATILRAAWVALR